MLNAIQRFIFMYMYKLLKMYLTKNKDCLIHTTLSYHEIKRDHTFRCFAEKFKVLIVGTNLYSVIHVTPLPGTFYSTH